MNTSLFIEYIDKYFRKIVGKIVEKFNGKDKEPQYLHEAMLTEEYSADLTWGANEINHSVVAADVVALDSSLPLKKRGTLGVATGAIPKIGLKYRKSEKVISDINLMIARGADEATVASKIFDDVARVITAMKIRKEIMFLQGLSSGVTLIEDDANIGTGIRASFGYKAENTFGTTAQAWGVTSAKVMDDLNQIFDKAQEDSHSINHVFISKKYFNYLRKSDEGKLLAAAFANQVITGTSLLPTPSRSVFLEALADEYGATFHIVDASFKVEGHDGKTKPVKPYAEANIVGIPDMLVGRMVYGTLAEETNPVAGVNYEKAGTHILVSKYSKTDPLEEFTAGQALAIPVIDGADSIYLLVANDTPDIVVDPTSLTFTKSAHTTGKTVNVTAFEELTVASDETWCTATISDNVVTVKVDANAGTKRTATVTVTGDTGKTATIAVEQAAGT